MRHERGCEMRCLCATSEAYDHNDQVPIVVPCVSGGKHITLGCMGCTRSHGLCGKLHHMAVTVVQSGLIGNVGKVKMGGI